MILRNSIVFWNIRKRWLFKFETSKNYNILFLYKENNWKYLKECKKHSQSNIRISEYWKFEKSNKHFDKDFQVFLIK